MLSSASTLYPLVLLSLGIGVLEFMLPGERNGKTARTVRAVAGLCVLLAMLAPITEGLTLLRTLATEGPDGIRAQLEASTLIDTPEASISQEDLAQDLATAGETEVEAWVYETLEDRFGIPPAHASVKARIRITLDEDGVSDTARLDSVYISLSGTSALRDPHEIETWFSEALGCPVVLSVS